MEMYCRLLSSEIPAGSEAMPGWFCRWRSSSPVSESSARGKAEKPQERRLLAATLREDAPTRPSSSSQTRASPSRPEHLPRTSAQLPGRGVRIPSMASPFSRRPGRTASSSAAQKRARRSEPEPPRMFSDSRCGPTTETSSARSSSVKSRTDSHGGMHSDLTSAACLRAHASTGEARSVCRLRKISLCSGLAWLELKTSRHALQTSGKVSTAQRRSLTSSNSKIDTRTSFGTSSRVVGRCSCSFCCGGDASDDDVSDDDASDDDAASEDAASASARSSTLSLSAMALRKRCGFFVSFCFRE